LLCEHPPVLTLGRLADENNLLASPEELRRENISLHHIDRGGDVTLHAPGQLVSYPIFQLLHFGKDLRGYLHRLEQVIIDFLMRFDIVSNRVLGQTGVWVGPQKIASLGIGVRKWITYHGMAININTNLNLYNLIRPCGLNVRMTSIAKEQGKDLIINDAKRHLLECFQENFHLDWILRRPD